MHRGVSGVLVAGMLSLGGCGLTEPLPPRAEVFGNEATRLERVLSQNTDSTYARLERVLVSPPDTFHMAIIYDVQLTDGLHAGPAYRVAFRPHNRFRTDGARVQGISTNRQAEFLLVPLDVADPLRYASDAARAIISAYAAEAVCKQAYREFGGSADCVK